MTEQTASLAEDHIERAVARWTHGYDADLLAGKITQADHDQRIAEISAWREYRLAQIIRQCSTQNAA